MFHKLAWWLFAVKVSLCDCYSDRRKNGFGRGERVYQISEAGKLSPLLSELSGLARGQRKNTFWAHNDGGNPAELFEIEMSGKIVSKLELPQLKNIDWEDLAQDSDGNLYVADLGNNQNQRRDLQLHKFNPEKPQIVETIQVRYADQKMFPPLVNQRNFDCEAVAWHGGKLYLFSKNRSKTNHFVKMYSLPAQAGNYALSPQDSIYSRTMVTAADISPDGRTLALLTYGKVLLFDISAGVNFSKPLRCLKTGHGQTEAIAFINNQEFVFGNERKRNLYLVSLSQ